MRRNTVSLQTTVLAWIIEFGTGLLMLINILFSIDKEYSVARIIIPLDITLCTVVIPFSYILKTDNVKKVIVDSGWWKCLQNFICFRHTRIAPAENFKMNAPTNFNAVSGERQDPEQQNQRMQHANDLPPIELPEDGENWWMRIDLFDDDDSVETEENSKTTD